MSMRVTRSQQRKQQQQEQGQDPLPNMHDASSAENGSQESTITSRPSTSAGSDGGTPRRGTGRSRKREIAVAVIVDGDKKAEEVDTAPARTDKGGNGNKEEGAGEQATRAVVANGTSATGVHKRFDDGEAEEGEAKQKKDTEAEEEDGGVQLNGTIVVREEAKKDKRTDENGVVTGDERADIAEEDDGDEDDDDDAPEAVSSFTARELTRVKQEEEKRAREQ